MKVALIVGHDATLKGSYGTEGMSEWDFWDQFVHELILDGDFGSNHEVYVLYRNADLNGYSAKMRDLHSRMDRIGIKLGIECHFNGYSDPTVNGHEVLYDGANPRSIDYAEWLDECFDELPNRDRGVKVLTKGDNGFGFVAGSNIPCIIAEPFFGSHQSKYVYGGAYRGILKQSFEKFLERI